jgi:aminopeptidase N
MSQFSYFSFDDDRDRRFELPGAKPHYSPDRPGQVEHIALDLELDFGQRSLVGTCTLRINPVRDGIDRLTLDAVNLHIDHITVGKTALAFDSDGEHLLITLAKPTKAGKVFELAIAYRVSQPQRGIYFVNTDPEHPDRATQAWTQGEDEDSRYWFPCFDFPGQLSSSEIRVKVPKEYTAIANGTLTKATAKGKTKTFHWEQSEPHPTYLIALAVGEFAEIQDEWNGKPVTYYVAPDRREDARRTMGKTPAMIEFLSEKYGYPYPYAKYGQACVADFIFGGMENTSITLLTDRCLLDERAAIDNRNSEALVVHELAHQWFGDLLAIEHWAHAWVKEGMASYSEVMWTEREYGPDAAAYYRLNEMRSYLSEDRTRYRRPMVTHVYREAIELYDRHIYEKGSCVYHLIRAELGDELFWRAIQAFVKTHAFGPVGTVDLLRSIQQATGRNLQFLFDQYVFRGGHPDYRVAYSWDSSSHLAKITVTQTQAKDGDTSSQSGLFDLKVPIAFGTVTPSGTDAKTGKSGKKAKKAGKKTDKPEVTLQTLTVQVRDREQSFYFPLSAKPDFVSFDAGNHLLKTVTLDYPLPELTAQLAHDPDPIARIFAAEAIAKKGTLAALNALANALVSDPFWAVRAEVAEQLPKLKLDGVVAALQPGLTDEDARVRRAVVEALASLKTPEVADLILPIARDGDPSYRVEAAALKAIAAIAAARTDGDRESAQTEAIALLAEVLQTRAGWNEVVRSGAIAGLSTLKTSVAALDQILQHTDPATPQALRLASIRALGAISTGQAPTEVDRILHRLAELARESFFLTQVATVAALGQMETPQAIALLQDLADQSPDGRVRRMAEENIQKVQKNIGADKALKQLRDEVDGLKKDNQSLRSRLESLEAKAENPNPQD